MFKIPLVYQIIGAVGLGASLMVAKGFYDRHLIQTGVDKCQAAQKLADEEAEGLADTLGQDKDDADDTFESETKVIEKERNTGITELYLERATENSLALGEELGYSKAFAQIRAQGGCLADPYQPDDKLLIDARSLQREVFGDSLKSIPSSETRTVRGYPKNDLTLSGASPDRSDSPD